MSENINEKNIEEKIAPVNTVGPNPVERIKGAAIPGLITGAALFKHEIKTYLSRQYSSLSPDTQDKVNTIGTAVGTGIIVSTATYFLNKFTKNTYNKNDSTIVQENDTNKVYEK